MTEVRKTVTILFMDVVGSTGLGERLGQRSMEGVGVRVRVLAHDGQGNRGSR